MHSSSRQGRWARPARAPAISLQSTPFIKRRCILEHLGVQRWFSVGPCGLFPTAMNLAIILARDKTASSGFFYPANVGDSSLACFQQATLQADSGRHLAGRETNGMHHLAAILRRAGREPEVVSDPLPPVFATGAPDRGPESGKNAPTRRPFHGSGLEIGGDPKTKTSQAHPPWPFTGTFGGAFAFQR